MSGAAAGQKRSMHDLLIKGGTVVDGTGATARTADVAVEGGIVAAVGKVGGPARRTINAEGALVLPGWVDIHTHYDGQATWDPELTPSSLHGVTTTVFGNCGVGFAPVRPGSEPYLINLMEGVEDIPGTVLAEGVDFRWESFPEYMDVVAETPRTMDVGTQVPHGVLRFYVMGDRGADHETVPTEDEIAEMRDLAEAALRAGALGISTSRTTKHKAADGRMTPGLSADQAELFGLADAMRRADAGVFQCNTDFGPGEYGILEDVARHSGRPLSVLLLQIDREPLRWRETLDSIERSNRAGLQVRGQVGCRPIGVMMGLDTSMNPFATHPAWRAIAELAPAARIAALREADLQRRLVEERPTDSYTKFMAYGLTRASEFTPGFDYEPLPIETIAARADAASRSPWDVALETMLNYDGNGLLFFPFENYSDGNLAVIRELLMSPHTVSGLGDGGAHVATLCDAGYPTFLLSYWARDRVKGPGLPLEHLVRKQTAATAQSYGLHDRGQLQPGFRADINVVDFDALQVTRPEIVYDLPAGGKRLVQGAEGYLHTFVSGVEVRSMGEFTGARPGRLLRGATALPGTTRTAA